MVATIRPNVRVCDLVARLLVDAGIKCIFGYMGEDTAPLVVAAENNGVVYYASRHENQAVAMADGYARASRRVGVATVTSGPGFTNALTAINTAHRAHSGVIILVGGGRPSEDDHCPGVIRLGTSTSWLKFFPQRAVCEAAGIAVFMPPTASEATAATSLAIQRARGGDTVVVVLGRQLLLESAAGIESLLPSVDPDPRPPDANTICALADLLQETWAVTHPRLGLSHIRSSSPAAVRSRRTQRLPSGISPS